MKKKKKKKKKKIKKKKKKKKKTLCYGVRQGVTRKKEKSVLGILSRP
jgi:hypothetical protein